MGGAAGGDDTAALIAAGDRGPRAFAALYARVAPALCAWARLRAPRGEAAFDPDDVVQETWLAAWRRFADFDPARGAFRPWIFGVANRALLAALRRRGARRGADEGATASAPSALVDDATSVSRAAARDEAVRGAVAALVALDDDDRDVVVYLGFEGLSAREAAELVGASQAAVEKRWQRVRARLRALPAVRRLLDDDQ